MPYVRCMKRCYECGDDKPLSEFNRNATRPDGLQTRCRSCQKLSSQRYYQTNRERMCRQISAARSRRRDDLRDFVWAYLLEHPCVDCGEPDPWALDFDHVTGKKVMTVSTLVMRAYSLTALKAEIAKCVVRCSPCHRKRTAVQFGWRMGRSRIDRALLAQLDRAPSS